MINQVEFNGSVITVIIKDRDVYFRANDVVKALGYTSGLNQPVARYVSAEYITVFEKIRPENFVDKAIAKYIQKNGILELAFKCRLESAKPFQTMVLGYLDQLSDDNIGYYSKRIRNVIVQISTRSHRKISRRIDRSIRKANSRKGR